MASATHLHPEQAIQGTNAEFPAPTSKPKQDTSPLNTENSLTSKVVSRDRGSRSPTSDLPPAPCRAPPASRTEASSLQQGPSGMTQGALPDTHQRGEDSSTWSMRGFCTFVCLKVPEPGWTATGAFEVGTFVRELWQKPPESGWSHPLAVFPWMSSPRAHRRERQREKMSGKDWPGEHFENQPQLRLWQHYSKVGFVSDPPRGFWEPGHMGAFGRLSVTAVVPQPSAPLAVIAISGSRD